MYKKKEKKKKKKKKGKEKASSDIQIISIYLECFARILLLNS